MAPAFTEEGLTREAAMKHERERTAEGRQQWNRTMAARSKTLARAASSPLPQRPALFDVSAAILAAHRRGCCRFRCWWAAGNRSGLPQLRRVYNKSTV